MIEQFLNYLQLERNYSLRTVQAYSEDLMGFEEYFKNMDSSLTWQMVDADIIRSWIESMMDKGNTATTINRRLSGLRSFFRFAMRRGLLKKDPSRLIRGPKNEKPLPSFVKESEMDALLEDGRWTDAYDDVLARTLFIILYETGMRRAELTGLNMADVDFAANELSVVGKGNKHRKIPFGRELSNALQLYAEKRNEVACAGAEAFFVTKKGVRMNGEQVRYIVRKKLAGVTTMKKRSPHVLRHSFATAMLNHQAGIEGVRKLLGHKSVMTTEVYTHVTFEQMRKVYDAAHPRHSDNNL